MNNKQKSLTKLVVLAWMIVVIISNISIGALSYLLYRGELYDARADEAKNVALSIALRIDGAKMTEIMENREKNEYWHEIKQYADEIAGLLDTAFIYILDKNYDSDVTYFVEGTPGETTFDLGMTEQIEGIYADEMFTTLTSGQATTTEPYPSGDYGDMVSGFAAVTDQDGRVAGVVGVDFYYTEESALLRTFLLAVVGIILFFIIGSYFLMSYLGTKLAGKPLVTLDHAARQFADGDMDIHFNFQSTTEIGRLAASFERMIQGMKEQVAALEALSQGNLTSQVTARSDKDVMGIAITKILSNLNDMINEIKESAAHVSMGSEQLSDNAQALATGANQQAMAVERLSSSIAGVTDTTNENVTIANKTNLLTDSILTNAQVGSEQMDKMLAAVRDITEASEAIGKVIKAIDDIAFQTNILALNASVEAARAGQHGKGFAVVAGEVRNLATKSAAAAKDSEQLIRNSMEKANLGASIADETVANLNEIIEGVNECAVSVGVITKSLNGQIQSMHQINRDIEQVSHVVQENLATAEESASASRQMSEEAQVLDSLVSRFKLKDQNLLPGRGAPSADRSKALPPSQRR